MRRAGAAASGQGDKQGHRQAFVPGPATTTALHHLDMDPTPDSINLVFPMRKVTASARVRSPPSNQRPLFY